MPVTLREGFVQHNTLHAFSLPRIFRGASVVVYEEVDDSEHRLERWEEAFDALAGWDQYVHHDVAAGAVRITWDTDVWEFVDGGGERTHDGFRYLGHGVSPHRYIVWARLRHKVTGEIVRVVGTHLISGVRGKGKAPRSRRLACWMGHARRLRALLREWRDELVVVLGDFNREPAKVALPITLVAHSHAETNGAIDQIWASHQLRCLDGGEGRNYGSDHPIVRAVLTTDRRPAPPPVPPTPEVTVKKLPANLPDLLRAEGLKVEVLKGWQDRGRPASTGGFNPVGVLWHHTGSYDSLTDAQDDRQYAAWLGLTGRSDLPAPLCHLSISAEGIVYVIAAGRANHAGKARASGSVAAGDGNELYVGVECMNSGKQGWGKPQYDAMVKTAVVLARVLAPNGSPRAQRGHRETSITGKWDPGMLDLDKFRADIEAALEPAPTPDEPNRVELATLAIQAAIDNAQATVPKSRVEFHHGLDDMETRLARMPRR